MAAGQTTSAAAAAAAGAMGAATPRLVASPKASSPPLRLSVAQPSTRGVLGDQIGFSTAFSAGTAMPAATTAGVYSINTGACFGARSTPAAAAALTAARPSGVTTFTATQTHSCTCPMSSLSASAPRALPATTAAGYRGDNSM